MADVPILIPAAGASSRMRGRDKLLEIVDGTPQLRRVIDAALASSHPVLVGLPAQDGPRHRIVSETSATAVPIPDAHLGLNATLSRLLTGLEAPAAMILLADLPDIDTTHIAALFAARDIQPNAQVWRGVTADGAPGHPTIIARDLFAPIIALEGDTGAQPVLSNARQIHVPLPGKAARCDLDTPEDWAAWRRHRKR